MGTVIGRISSAERGLHEAVRSLLMGTVIERISSTESGLHEAFMSLLKGFEVREIMYAFNSTAYVRYAHADSSP